MSDQTQLPLITDTSYRVSVNTDIYKCHRCKKRKHCKDRHPEKAVYGAWEKRRECDKYEEAPEWWQ